MDEDDQRITRRSLPLLTIAHHADHRLLIQYALLSSIPQVKAVFASTAQEAFDYLDHCVTHWLRMPCLVLLELPMPTGNDAWALLIALKQRYPSLPVVVLGTEMDLAEVKHTYAMGANAVMDIPSDLSGWERHFQIMGQYWFDTVRLPSDPWY